MIVEQMFQSIETHYRGRATIPSQGLTQLRHLLNKLGTDSYTHTLVKASFEQGYEMKVVRQEISIFCPDPRFDAFYANLAVRKKALEIHFNEGDERYPHLQSLFEKDQIERGYKSFNLRSPQEVAAFIEAVRHVEKTISTWKSDVSP